VPFVGKLASSASVWDTSASELPYNPDFLHRCCSTGKSVAGHPLNVALTFYFARTTANIAETPASSAAFFALTDWNIYDGFLSSAMTCRA
jgi:hypothetical protein